MTTLSSNGRGSQQPQKPRVVIRFDPQAELLELERTASKPPEAGSTVDDDGDDFDHDCDTLTDDRGDSDGHSDDDPPPANSSAAVPLIIHAPRGPQPVRPGFTIAAVVLDRDEDGEEEILSNAFLTPQKMQSATMAIGVANFKALKPERLPIKDATHIVVNDETGLEVFRVPLLRVA